MALSSINPENQKCPYVGCEHKGAIPAISGDVHRCSHCNRLALKCEKPDCEALNRPFSRFCRRCGDDMSRPDYGKTVSSQWLESRRFSEPFPDFVFGRAEIQKFGRELEPGILAIIASLRNESQMTSRLRIAIRSSLWAKPESVQIRFDVVESQDLRSEGFDRDFEQKLTEALRKDLATPFVTIAQQITSYILGKLQENESLSHVTAGIENTLVEDLFRHTHNLRLYFLRYLIERGPFGTQPSVMNSPAGPEESVQGMAEMLRSQPTSLATIIGDTLNKQRSDLQNEISKYLVKELEDNPRFLIERLNDRSSDHQDSQYCTPANEIAETLASKLKRQPRHLARFLEDDIAVLPQLRQPESLVEVQFLDGLLAVHQAGSYQGLYHPFASIETAKILQLRDRPGVSPGRRPWRPTLIDRRFIVFSHPEFARSVDAWSLTGWSVRGNAETHDLFHCPPEARLTLAAAPVSFEGLTVGLLFYDADEEAYLWLTLDISQSKLLNSEEIRNSASALEISGTPCEVDSSMDQAITFSTSSGHWVWKTEDARNSRTDKMERLKTRGTPKTDDGLVRGFHFPRQKLFLHSIDSAETELFNWYYQTIEGPEMLECCRVYFSTLHAETLRLPLRRKMIPLGKRRTASGEMVIVEDGKVWSESLGKLTPLAENLTIESNFTGLTFEDPLLLTIGSRLSSKSGMSSKSGIRRLTIRSIENLNHSLSFEVNPPYSNPILWGRWLFTTEYDTEGEIVLRRRILSSPD